jgi:hypothetical protein
MSKFNNKSSSDEYLKAFLASEVRNYLNSRYGLVDGFTYKYTDEDVNKLVHEMYFGIRDSIVESDIFYEVVEYFVSKHTKKEENEIDERGVNYKIEKTKIVSCVNGFVTSGLMKINNIIIEDYHEQDCCEHVYADFSALEDTTFFDEIKGKNLTAKEVANNIELVEGKGFRIFGYFVPCYNVQDGYYSSNLTLIITEEHGKNKIEIDLTNCTSWRGR